MNLANSYWRHLAFLGFDISNSALRSSLSAQLPRGIEWDDYQGTHYLTLVGFLPSKTRILGIPLWQAKPSGRLELRLNVKRKKGSGVQRGFLRVTERGKPIRAFVDIHFEEGGIDGMGRPFSNGVYQYRWAEGQKNYHLTVKTEGLPQPLSFSPEAQFLMQRPWIFRRRWATPLTHKEWFYWDMSETALALDAEAIWGGSYAAVMAQSPALSFLAKGSKVEWGVPRLGYTRFPYRTHP